MTYVIMPVKYDVLKTLKAVRSFGAYSFPAKLVVVIDNDEEIQKALGPAQNSEIILPNSYQLGFWNSLNFAINHLNIPMNEPIVYIGNDVEFTPGWHDAAFWKFKMTFGASGLGLLSFYDGIHNGFNASHGMTTRAWLNIINGTPAFCGAYFHYFHDSEMTNRSRDLLRYTYAEESRVLHHHDGTKYGDGPDKILKDARDREWARSGRKQAERKLDEILARA